MPPSAAHAQPQDEAARDRAISLTLAKGLAILSAFRPGETYLSNRELAERTGFSKPTVSRLARTLLELGYLRHSPALGRYALGTAVLTLAYPMLGGLGIRHLARPFMQELAEEVSGQVSMGMRDRTRMVFVESARSPAHRLTLPEIGATVPILASSMGRAYVAAMAPAERAAFLDWLRASDPEGVERQAEGLDRAIRCYAEHGFATSFGEVRREMYACAVPLRTAVDGERVVVNCGVPARATSPDAFVREIGPRLVATARSIDAAAGGGLASESQAARRAPAAAG